MSKTHLTEIKFAELGLEPQVLAGLEAKGFQESRHGQPAHYVIERAFVEK